MNQELKRIREKDFTKIDQTLFQNVSRTDNLNFTLTHLTEFQKYLMEQISALNHPSAKVPKDNKIADSLAKTFDNLKQSILKCSQMRQKTSKTKFQKLKKQINDLKKLQQKAIKQIVDEKDKLFLKNKQDFEKVANIIMDKYQSQKQKNQELQIRCHKLQSELKEMKLLKSQQQVFNPAIQYKQKMIQIQTNNSIKRSQQKMPLRQMRTNQQNISLTQVCLSQPLHNKDWKIMRDKVSNYHLSVYNSAQKSQQVTYHYNNTPLKRTNSNHRLSSKTHIAELRDKQNSNYMISKGDVIQKMTRGKSKQKIKVCSMF